MPALPSYFRFSLRSAGWLLGLLITLTGAGGCKEEETSTAATKEQIEAQKKVDEDRISAYVAAQNLRAIRTASGLYYVKIDSAAATAPQAVNGKKAVINYYGKLLDGTSDGRQFDSSYTLGRPLEFEVGRGQVISGWDEVAALMRKGDRWRVIIPSHLGYGPRGTSGIPPNSVLIFYMKLENVL